MAVNSERDEFSPKWRSILLRMRTAAKSSPKFERSKASYLEYSDMSIGHSKLISITVLTNDDGEPILWTAPTCRMVEPNRGVNDWLDQL